MPLGWNLAGSHGKALQQRVEQRRLSWGFLSSLRRVRSATVAIGVDSSAACGGNTPQANALFTVAISFNSVQSFLHVINSIIVDYGVGSGGTNTYC